MRHVLMLLRYDDGAGDELRDLVAEGLQVLGRQPGFVWGCAARSPDEPDQWVLAVRWDGAGAMRRGVGSYEARVALGLLQRFAVPGSGSFEILGEQVSVGYVAGSSELDPEADRSGPGRDR